MKKAFFIIFTVFLGIMVMECRHAIPEPIIITPTPPTNDSICFTDQLYPLLVSNCAQSGCHDAITKHSNVNMSSYSDIVSTVSGTLLLQVIQDPASHQTPNFSTLTDVQINLVQKWVNEGMRNGNNCQPCDSLNVTFSGTINPIIQNDCISCHTTGTLLTSYADVKASVDSGTFLCSVEQKSNTCQAMPQDGLKLSVCKIGQIRAWIMAGAPNN